MDFFTFLSFLGGLAVFLFGIETLGDGLARTAGSRMEEVLEKLTSTPIRGVLLGAAVTAVIQSSGATTVMVVGFVNSGIMKLRQAVGVILGASIGTTMTAWILSLSEIRSDSGTSFFIRMISPDSFTPVLAFIGVVLMMFGKSDLQKNVGTILMGFAVLMFGMDMMEEAMAPLADMPGFRALLVKFSNPLLGVLFGAAATAIMNSSSAAIGILQALSKTGVVSFMIAIPVLMGMNFGSCITAMMSSVGARTNAKRAAFVNFYYKLIAVMAFLVGFYVLNAVFRFAIMDEAASPVSIAKFHTLFNIAATFCMLPFAGVLEKLSILTVKNNEEDEEDDGLPKELALLDDRFLEQPAYAVLQCVTAANKMAELTQEAIETAMDLVINGFQKKKAKRVAALENIMDVCEDRIGTYLIKLSSKNITMADNQKMSIILHCLSNFERITDRAYNIYQASEEMEEKDFHFSEECQKELLVYTAAVREIVSMMVEAFQNNDLVTAKRIEPLEEVIDNINARAKKHHIKRLKSGVCTMEPGVILEDITTNLERVSDHCSNVGVTLIEVSEDVYDTHEYLDTLKAAQTPEFEALYREYDSEFHI